MSLLEKIQTGVLKPIGWGTGQMLKYRRHIHDFELLFTIDTREEITEKHGLKVELPSILEKIDRKNYILIVYSVEFLGEAYSYCEKYPELFCIPFNSNELGTGEKLRDLKSAHDTFAHHGISYLNIRNIDPCDM